MYILFHGLVFVQLGQPREAVAATYYRAQCLHKPWRKLFVEQPCGEVR